MVSEGQDAMMPVVIAKASDVFTATDVTFMVIPLTVDEALAQGVIENFDLETHSHSTEQVIYN